jgi:hypothetical protein
MQYPREEKSKGLKLTEKFKRAKGRQNIAWRRHDIICISAGKREKNNRLLGSCLKPLAGLYWFISAVLTERKG